MDELLRKVETLYGIQIHSAEPIRDIYKLTTDHGYLCLKSVDYRSSKLLFIYHAMEHLLKNGFDLIPAFVHNLAGDPYFTYEGQHYFVSEWMNGRECNFKNLVDLELAMMSLAKLHKASIGFKPSKKIKVKSRLSDWPTRYQKRIDDLKKFKEIAEQKKSPTKFDTYYLKHADSKINDAVLALQFLDCSEYKRLVKQAKQDGSFCHNDFVYHNILIDDSQPVASVVDFDYCRHDLRMYDLARLIRRVIKGKKNQKDILDVILTSYNSEFPLLTEEYPILAAFLQFPQRFWRMADRYYNSKRDWSEKKFYSRLKRSVRQQRNKKLLVKEILSYEQDLH